MEGLLWSTERAPAYRLHVAARASAAKENLFDPEQPARASFQIGEEMTQGIIQK